MRPNSRSIFRIQARNHESLASGCPTPPTGRDLARAGSPRFALRSLVVTVAMVALASCGGVANVGTGGSFQNATSVSCTNTVGLEALYWDYMNGIIRVDYPETWRFIPYAPGTPFFHPVQPLYNFIYPSNWTAETLSNPGSQLTGANVIRPDGRAVWRRLNYTLPGTVSATEALNGEVQGVLGFLGNPGPVQEECFLAEGGRAALLMRSGAFTANVTTGVFVSGGVTVVFAQLVVAPTAEYDDMALNVFFPLSGQMNLGGGSGDPECSDGIDNDGDGQTDYPDDPGCTSVDDDSEAG